MPPEIQTAEVAVIVAFVAAITSILGAYVHSIVTRKKNQDTLTENQTAFESVMLKNQAAFDAKYQSFFVDRVAILLDERKQLWSERSRIAEEYLAYQKDASASVLRAEESVKRLELQLTGQADKLASFDKTILALTSDRNMLLEKLDKITTERDTFQTSLRQSQEVILKQQAAVNELDLLKGQYSALEKRVYELEANEKELIEQVNILRINEAVLKREADIYRADRDNLIGTLAKVASSNGEGNGGKVATGDVENKARGAAS